MRKQRFVNQKLGKRVSRVRKLERRHLDGMRRPAPPIRRRTEAGR